MRKALSAFLSVLCLLAALGQGSLATLVSLTGSVVADCTDEGDWPCKYHHCGCKTKAQCLAHCCCYKHEVPSCCAHHHHAEQAESNPAVDLLSALACAGGLPDAAAGDGPRIFLTAEPTAAPQPRVTQNIPLPADPRTPETRSGPIFHPPRLS